MSITYFEMSYPNFVLGAIIDPEEANQNNYEITLKTNALITEINKQEVDITNLTATKATIVYVDERFANLSGVGRTSETVKQNATNLIVHKTSADHDYKYYLKTEIDSKVSVINNNLVSNVATLNSTIDSKIAIVTSANTANTLALSNHRLSGDHDTRYYTKEELIPWLRGGDTLIKEETYIITNPNIDGVRFSYNYEGVGYIGELHTDGGQIFILKTGFYQVNQHRIDVMIDDTLRRSVASGGLVELSETSILITTPEDVGTEITVKYFERVGLVAEYNIKMSVEKPPTSGGKNMWFKIIG